MCQRRAFTALAFGWQLDPNVRFSGDEPFYENVIKSLLRDGVPIDMAYPIWYYLAERCLLEDKRIDPQSAEYESTLYYKLLSALQALSYQHKEDLILILSEKPEGVEFAEYLQSLEMVPVSRIDAFRAFDTYHREKLGYPPR